MSEQEIEHVRAMAEQRRLLTHALVSTYVRCMHDQDKARNEAGEPRRFGWGMEDDRTIATDPHDAEIAEITEDGVTLSGQGETVVMPWHWLTDPERVLAEVAVEAAERGRLHELEMAQRDAEIEDRQRDRLKELLAKHGPPSEAAVAAARAKEAADHAR